MDTPADQDPQKPVRKMRWIGFLMFVAGGVLAYLCIYVPLAGASHHEDDLSISPKAVMFVPGLIILGLIVLFLGNDGAGRLFGSRDKRKVIGVAICIVVASIGILLYEWLKSKLREYGYAISE